MKRLVTLLMMVVMAVAIYADDIIILKNSIRIDAKIVEVTSTEVKYHKASNPDGQLFTLNVSEVSSIVFENGDVRSFENNTNNGSNRSNNYTEAQTSNSTQSGGLRNANSFAALTLNYNLMNMHDKSSNDYDLLLENKDDEIGFFPKLLNGFSIGVLAQSVLYKNLVLLYGASYELTMWGYNDSKSETGKYYGYTYQSSNEWKVMYWHHNIRIPLKLGFSMPFGNKSSFSVYVGPSLDVNLATERTDKENASVKYSGKTKTAYYTESVEFLRGKWKKDNDGDYDSGTDDDYKRMFGIDVPLGLGVIYNIGHIGFRVEYEWGLINRIASKWNNKYDNNLKMTGDHLTIGLLIIF